MNDLKFSVNSVSRLETCVPELQILAYRSLAIDLIDFAVIWGHRNKEQQNKMYASGKSEKQWPDGKHNKLPSEAMDLAPVINGIISWDPKHHIYLAGIITTVAIEMLGIRIRWGGNWDYDREPITDQNFNDLGHYEILGGYV